MGSIRTAPTVTVQSPGIGATPAVVRRWSWTRGAQAAECVLDLPEYVPDRTTWSDGLELNVFVESYPVFKGVTVATSRTIGGSDQQVRISARDMRHVLQGRPIGEWYVGPLFSTSGFPDGGWPGMGYDLIFNKNNQPNRAASRRLTSNTGHDVYDFSFGDTAEYWTFTQILAFLFYWYVNPNIIRLPHPASSWNLYYTIYDSSAPEVDAQTGTLAHVIDRVTSQLGGSWTLAYDGAPGSGNTHAYYMPLHEAIGPSLRVAVEVDKPNTSTVHTKYAASRIDLTESTGHVYDKIQVFSDSRVVETTYSNLQNAPLLERKTSDIPDDYICYFVTKPDNYEPHALAPNLSAFDRPKPWRRYLVTRRKDDGTYADPDDNKDNHNRIECKDTVWITDEADKNDPTWHRVKSGVDIDLDKARLRVKKEVTVYGDKKDDTSKLKFDTFLAVGIQITVATRVEYPDYAKTDTSQEYLNYSRMRSVTRSDLQPLYRYNSVLPDPSSSDPHSTTVAASSWETYEDVQPELDAYRDRLYNATSQKEQRARIRLPQFPGIQLGWELTFTPADYGLPNLRVREVQYDPVNYDTIVTATSNMDMATV